MQGPIWGCRPMQEKLALRTQPWKSESGKGGTSKSQGQPDMLKPKIGGAQANQPLERTPPRCALRRRSTAR